MKQSNVLTPTHHCVFHVSWQFKSLSRYVSSCPSSVSYLKGVIYNYRKFFSFKYKMYKPNNESQFGIACFSILRKVAKPLKEDLLLPLERHRYILYIVQNFYFLYMEGITLMERFPLFLIPYRSSTCPLTGFFWLLSHVIYLKLSIIRVFSFSILQNFNF